MQNIPVDVTQLVCLAMGPARPKIKNRQTGEVATDQQGRPITQLRVACVPVDETSDDDGDMDVIQTTAEVPPMRRGTQLVVTGLVARPYAFRDQSGEQRAGVTFWAQSIAPMTNGKAGS
jgi:hypothetical protein